MSKESVMSKEMHKCSFDSRLRHMTFLYEEYFYEWNTCTCSALGHKISSNIKRCTRNKKKKPLKNVIVKGSKE